MDWRNLCCFLNSLSKEEETRREAKAGQLTIFYLGRVLVFDDYPVDKVRELVSIAKKSSSQMSYGITPNTIQEKTSPPTSSAREGLPPRPQPRSGKQPAGISSNTCKEKVNPTANVDVGLSSRSEELASTQSEANGSGNWQFHYLREEKKTFNYGIVLIVVAFLCWVADLPIARRSSLHRFLEKRKDRYSFSRLDRLPNCIMIKSQNLILILTSYNNIEIHFYAMFLFLLRCITSNKCVD